MRRTGCAESAIDDGTRSIGVQAQRGRVAVRAGDNKGRTAKRMKFRAFFLSPFEFDCSFKRVVP
jgi:hypothetical protein